MDRVIENQGREGLEATILEVRQGFGQRQAMLAPYYERLHGLAAAVPAGSVEIELDRWEQLGLRQVIDYGQPTTHGLALLFDGVALRTKVAEELALLEGGSVRGDALRRLVAELITDAAIGLVLVVESQTVINDTINAGNIREAKHLSVFRNRVRGVIGRIADRLGEQAHRKAREMAAAMVADSNRRVMARRGAGAA